MTPLAYTGYRPTKFYRGLGWYAPNFAIIGVELAPHATGFVIFGFWIGVVSE